jgi:hypothetical protein
MHPGVWHSITCLQSALRSATYFFSYILRLSELSQQGISPEIARFIDVEVVKGEGDSNESSSEYEDDAGNYNYKSVMFICKSVVLLLTAFIVDNHADSNVAM